MDIQATTGTAVPKLAVFDIEDCLREKLNKLETVMYRIRTELLGGQPTGKDAKEPESPTGFFSAIQHRLQRDVDIVDAITVVAHEVQRGFGKQEPITP